jgi:hypothetical protein
MIADGTAVVLNIGLTSTNLSFLVNHNLTKDWQHIALLGAPVHVGVIFYLKT